MAVYTEVSDEALAGFLEGYDLGTMVAFRGIAEGVENSNFSLRTTTGDFILTLYEKRVDPADLPWFLGLMEHLASRGITCPLPVRGRDGSALHALAGRPACVTTFLPGVWPRRVRQMHCVPVGRAVAALHLAGADYAPVRPNALGPDGWRPMLDRCLPRADEVQPAWRCSSRPRWTASWVPGPPVCRAGISMPTCFRTTSFSWTGTCRG